MQMVRVTTDLPKAMDNELDALVAIGLYKSKSEALRDALRELLYKYKDKIKIDPVQTSHRLRLAAKSVDTKNFDDKALNFCKEVNKKISK